MGELLQYPDPGHENKGYSQLDSNLWKASTGLTHVSSYFFSGWIMLHNSLTATSLEVMVHISATIPKWPYLLWIIRIKHVFFQISFEFIRIYPISVSQRYRISPVRTTSKNRFCSHQTWPVRAGGSGKSHCSEGGGGVGPSAGNSLSRGDHFGGGRRLAAGWSCCLTRKGFFTGIHHNEVSSMGGISGEWPVKIWM